MGIFGVNKDERMAIANAHATMDYLLYLEYYQPWLKRIAGNITSEMSKSNYKLRAEQNDAYSQFVFGVYSGVIERNDDMFLDLVKKAAEQGWADAMYVIAKCCDHWGEKKTAFNWYLTAAQAGNIDAMYMVGFHYKYGGGEKVAVNSNAGISWLCEAGKAGLGDTEKVGSLAAQSTMGAVLFEMGEYARAQRSLKIAEARGWANASALLKQLPLLFRG